MKNIIKYLSCSLFVMNGLYCCLAAADEVSNAPSPIPVITDHVQFTVSPYVWFPSVSSTIADQTGSTDFYMDNAKVLRNVVAGFMQAGEAHYGRFGIMGNAMVSKSTGVQMQGNVTGKSWLEMYTVAGTYTLVYNPELYTDVFVGARFFNMRGKATGPLPPPYPPVMVTGYSSINASDAIAGIKGKWRLGESQFFVPYYFDAGGGSALTQLTSQQMAGIGYTFNWGDLIFAYNNVYYKMHMQPQNNDISVRTNFSGPTMGATFSF